jgi:hypothetical protein
MNLKATREEQKVRKVESLSKPLSHIEIWDKVPWEGLPLSAKVDMCQLLSQVKPAIRLHVQDQAYLKTLISIFDSLSWYTAYDMDGYIVISAVKDLPHTILEVDQNPSPHEIHLGSLLGYPNCCCQYISQYGESQIDQLAEAFKKENLADKFKLIDISYYNKGLALLSHIPCSYECLPSLQRALFLKKFILSSNLQGGFLSWSEDVRNYFVF